MAATIRFRDGTEATLLSARNEWKCDVPHLKELLEETYEEIPSWAYYPTPIKGIASEVARRLYAKVIHADPEGLTSSDDPNIAY